MTRGFKKHCWALVILIAVGGIIPVFHYWYFIGRLPQVTPLEARQLVAGAETDFVLVDVRSPADFAEAHVAGAENWPASQIAGLQSIDVLPDRFRNKTLLLICDSGVNSARSVQILQGQSYQKVFNVKGGIQAWIASAGSPGGIEVKLVSASGQIVSPPSRESVWYEQLALAGAVLIVKPLYMLIALALILFAWRFTAPGMTAFRWGMISFLAGETACAANIAFSNHSSDLLEFFHMYGMVLGFGFVSYAVLELVDSRTVGSGDAANKCAFRSLCNQCTKSSRGSCKLERLFYFLLPVLMILAILPLLANFNVLSYNTRVLSMFYNYSHPVIYQIFELRYAPLYALFFITASFIGFLALRGDHRHYLKGLLAMGIGALAFSYLRLIFFGIYHDNMVWANFWEELTELMYTGGAAYVLWVFRPTYLRALGNNISVF